MIPLIHDLTEKKVVIFGGGSVGLRKARYFSSECQVVVISRKFCKGFEEDANNSEDNNNNFNSNNNCNNNSKNKINLIHADISSMTDLDIEGMIKDAYITIAALSEVTMNNRIGDIAKKLGIIFNNADGESGDIIIPSVIRGQNYLVALSTCGKSPAMTKYLRESLQNSETFKEVDSMIDLQCRLREILKKNIDDQKRRSAIIHSVIGDEKVWNLLSEPEDQNHKAALEYVKEVYLK